MKNKCIILAFLLLCATLPFAHAQTDSLPPASPPMASPPADLATVKSVQVLEQSVQVLELARLSELETKYKKRHRKISQTPDFIKAANNSLCALNLSGNLTDYLQNVGSLNNPENKELGLSLQTTVTKIIDEKIFKGKSKVGKQDRGRFMNVVNTIIKSPLVASLASSLPVVSSLYSVTDLVTSLTVNNEEVAIEDYESYKQEIANYVTFYQALGSAGSSFNTKINNLNVRIADLENIIHRFALERTNSLYPGFSGMVETSITMNELTRKYLERDAIAKIMGEIEKSAMFPGQAVPDFEKILNDPRLAFPDFAVSQARYITDELAVLGNEYLAAFQAYQMDIETVLTSFPNIVEPNMVEKKISSLRSEEALLEKALFNAMNMEEVRERFDKLIGSQ